LPSGLPLKGFYMGRMLNFGHRGASHDAPENTLAAFELAAQYGADGVELDVLLTRDGHPVVMHNDRVDKTTDGTGLVAEMTLAEIKALDAGSYFSPAFVGEQVPTLDEVFATVSDRLLINVELKGVAYRADGLEAAVIALIEQHDMVERVLVSSFNPVRLRRMRRLAPHIPLGYLHTTDVPVQVRWMAGALTWGLHPEADHPNQKCITPDYMTHARRRKQRVNAWVVNDPDRMVVLRDMGVDMIMTDRPDVLRAVMHGER
jgi:glycerophosphoryl diester phosphodiesterase